VNNRDLQNSSDLPDQYRDKIDSLDQPHKMGEVLENTFKESNKALNSVRNIIKDLINNDVQTKNILKGLIRSVEKEKTIWFLRGIGKFFSYVFTLVLGSIFTFQLQRLRLKYRHHQQRPCVFLFRAPFSKHIYK
jgi:hypothetical protein